MNSIIEIKQFYDEATIRKLHGFIYSNLRIEYAWQNLKSIFEFKDPKRILEIGSGIGEISYRLACEFKNTEVVGFDISKQSIEISKKLFISPNLSFIRADKVTEIKFSNTKKFDVIFLMDVYEHIPVEDRNELYQFINENISVDGFVFFSCPTPQHLAHLKINSPGEIQPVDEDISLKVLEDFSSQTNLKLILYKEVSVWSAGDYFHALFSNYLAMQPYCDFKKEKKAQTIGLKREIIKKVMKIINTNKPDPCEQIIMERKNLIKSRLGQKISEKVEAYTG